MTNSRSPMRCEPDRLLLWLREMLAAASEDVKVCVVVEQAADTGVSVHITVQGVREPLAGFDVRSLA